MKHNKIQILTIATAVTAGLLIAHSAQAQGITGGQYLSTFSGAGYSGDWNAGNVNNTATGIEIVAPGGAGSFSTLYSPIPVPQPNNPSVTEAVFDYTLNSGNVVAGGIAVIFSLDDSAGNAEYYNFGYHLYTPGVLNSVVVPLNATTLADIAGGAVINGFNLQMDPANVNGSYDFTYNSITLTSVPEPSTFAYSAFGVAAIWLFRRRK
ncbi:MAG TPA: PEP-CTERM sorting domain-containing protein [Candidatus Angelobacter sp.]|jgi:hypothetical protein|nr:PEP-CTERM sorting domain-containing protein [Candidatus Angelobacter sp.]